MTPTSSEERKVPQRFKENFKSITEDVVQVIHTTFEEVMEAVQEEDLEHMDELVAEAILFFSLLEERAASSVQRMLNMQKQIHAVAATKKEIKDGKEV